MSLSGDADVQNSVVVNSWLRCGDNGNLRIDNCSILGSVNGASSAGIGCSNSADLTIRNSILWNNGSEEFDSDMSENLSVSYSNIQGGWTGPGIINADPRFLDIGVGDFRLAAVSPCIDSGTETDLLEDLDGIPRPVDVPGVGRDGTGDEYDMGAYEYPIGVFPIWTPTPTATLTNTPTPTPTPSMLFDEVTDGRIDARDLLEMFRNGMAHSSSMGEPVLFHFSRYWRAVDDR